MNGQSVEFRTRFVECHSCSIKGYNTSHHNAKTYFDGISDVDKSELALCTETYFSNPTTMNTYAQHSGDSDGVVSSSDYSVIAKCFDDRWWYAPACRQTPSTCIPVFTAGNGWGLEELMQKSTAYGIPAAIAVSSSWSNWLKHVQNFRCLHYWWIPDSTFIDMQPEKLIFPSYSRIGWVKGDQKTASESVKVSKMVSRNLQSKASSVREQLGKVN